jgi:hypothetical protein
VHVLRHCCKKYLPLPTRIKNRDKKSGIKRQENSNYLFFYLDS